MELIDEAKERCSITWSDSTTDSRIINIVSEATAEMNKLLGSSSVSPVDYTADLMARDLLLNLILYKWNEQSEKFRDAYQQEIVECRRQYDVAQYETMLAATTEVSS